jgi:hypothetical protein
MSTSFYDLVHPADVKAVAHSFGELFKKSHCRTPFYRLIGANSSVAWVQTEATTVNHTARGQKGQVRVFKIVTLFFSSSTDFKTFD